MEFALKTAFINTFPTQAASPATCVPPSTCPFAECALGHGQGSPLVWARCPRETLQSWPRARGTGRRLFHHQALPPPPTLAEFTPGYSLGRCPRHHLPARPLRAPHPPHPARDTCGCFSCHAPRPRYQPVYLLSPAPDRCGPALPRPPQASVPQMSRKGRPWPCPSRLPGTQGRPRAAEEDSIYLRSLRAAAAGGHRRSGSSGHSASRRAPQEWGPPAGQTHGIK